MRRPSPREDLLRHPVARSLDGPSTQHESRSPGDGSGQLEVHAVAERGIEVSRWLAPLLFLLAALFATNARAAEVSYDLGFYSHYIWRGLTVTDGPVFQPTLSVSHESGFAVAVWGNLELDDANDRSGDFSEIDITPSFSWGSDAVTYEVGLIAYEFPNAFGPSTREAYFKLALGGVLAPTVAVYYDWDEIEDFYATLGVSHTFGLADPWSLSLAALAAYAGDGFAALSGASESGFHDGNVSLSLDYTNGAFSWGVLAAYTDSLDDEVLTPQPTDFWGGVYFSLSY